MFGYTLPGFLADAIIAVIVLSGICIGIKRGFIKTVARPVKFFASLAVAFSFCRVAGEKFIQHFIQSPIQNHLFEYLSKKCEIDPGDVNGSLPTLLKLAASLFNIDVNGVTGGETDTEYIIRSLVDNLTTPAISLFSTIIAFIALFFICKLVIGLLISVIDKMVQGGVVGAANKILGCVFGLLFAVILSWLLVCVCDFLFSLDTMNDKEVVRQIESGRLYQLLRTYNPIDLLLSF